MTAGQIFRLLFEGGNYAKQYLIKLYHAQAGTLYYVNNNQNVTYDGNTYVAANFDYTPPNSEGDNGSLSISAVDNAEVFAWVDAIDDKYSLEVIGILNGSEVTELRSYKHFYGSVSMSENNELSFSFESNGKLGMTFNIVKYDTDTNRGNS